MPLLDIATAQPSFRNHLYTVRFQTVHHGTFIFGNEKTRLGSSWRYFRIPEKAKNLNGGTSTTTTPCGGLLIKAVATFEPRCSIRRNDDVLLGIDSRSPLAPVENQYSSQDSAQVGEREKLRRMRISKANKGNTPWNKGRKHSEETRRRIRERTRLAMQDPKVRMKLINLGHAQSEETRIKIGVGVRIGWEKRREKLMLQETCHFEWQNLIAEASRRGFLGEEELEWDSYKIMDEQLEQEWLESVEQRKNMPRTKGSKRAPKSPEQRKKISEAIAAKWSDPAYRDRVYSGLSKYHGSPVGLEKPKRRAPSDRQPRKTSPTKKTGGLDNSAGNKIKGQNQRSKLKRSNVPLYKDPLANSKLEMIKGIRAKRAAAESTKSEAITRAKLLIAEAEKAADALEMAATKSSLAQASLIETRKLIAEAIKSIESIETGHANPHENGSPPSSTSSELINYVEEEAEPEVGGSSPTGHREVNGVETMARSDMDNIDFGFSKLNLQDLLQHDDDDDVPTSFYDHGSVNGKEQFFLSAPSAMSLVLLELDSAMREGSFKTEYGQLELNGRNERETVLPDQLTSQSQSEEEEEEEEETVSRRAKSKIWVRGKLVELEEEN